MNANRRNKRGAFFWVVFGGAVPLFIAALVATGIMMVAGVDVGGYVKDKVPLFSSIATTEDEKSLKNKLVRAKETIEEQEDEIADLENEAVSLEQMLDDVEKDEKKQAYTDEKEQSEAKEKKAANQTEDTKTEVDDLTQAAASFRKMDATQAAKILEELNQERALLILEKLSGDIRGDILEVMEADKAAYFIDEMLKDS